MLVSLVSYIEHTGFFLAQNGPIFGVKNTRMLVPVHIRLERPTHFYADIFRLLF
jgi:hypothetical protein